MTGPDSRQSSSYRDRNSTADRALDILSLFEDDRLTVTGADVASALAVAKSTAYRYLQSLTRSGFLEEFEPRGGFRLGPRVYELARLARKGVGLSDLARPVMRDLAEATGETVLLTRRSGYWVVCLELEESVKPVRLSYERGHVLPPNAGAAAQVLLAWESPEFIDKMFSEVRFEKFTAKTLTDARKLQQRLEDIRGTGYAVSRGELDADVVGIAAPIRDHSNNVAAAISIAALGTHVPKQREKGVVGEVRRAAARVSEGLRTLTM